MKSELRLIAFQETRSSNSVKLALVFDNDADGNEQRLAVKNDREGTTLIVFQNGTKFTEDKIKKALQYAISVALDVRLKGEIMQLSETDARFLKIEDTKVCLLV